jgi:hypothetical protein
LHVNRISPTCKNKITRWPKIRCSVSLISILKNAKVELRNCLKPHPPFSLWAEKGGESRFLIENFTHDPSQGNLLPLLQERAGGEVLKQPLRRLDA